MGLQCEWMLQCYLRHNILSERGQKKRTKRWKMPPLPQWLSQLQSVRSPSSPGLFFSLSLSRVFTLQWVGALLNSSCVCTSLVWSTELDSTFPSDWLAASSCLCLELLWEKVAEGETPPCENSRWQTDETRAWISSERAYRGCMLIVRCTQQLFAALEASAFRFKVQKVVLCLGDQIIAAETLSFSSDGWFGCDTDRFHTYSIL